MPELIYMYAFLLIPEFNSVVYELGTNSVFRFRNGENDCSIRRHL